MTDIPPTMDHLRISEIFSPRRTNVRWQMLRRLPKDQLLKVKVVREGHPNAHRVNPDSVGTEHVVRLMGVKPEGPSPSFPYGGWMLETRNEAASELIGFHDWLVESVAVIYAR